MFFFDKRVILALDNLTFFNIIILEINGHILKKPLCSNFIKMVVKILHEPDQNEPDHNLQASVAVSNFGISMLDREHFNCLAWAILYSLFMRPMPKVLQNMLSAISKVCFRSSLSHTVPMGQEWKGVLKSGLLWTQPVSMRSCSNWHVLLSILFKDTPLAAQ